MKFTILLITVLLISACQTAPRNEYTVLQPLPELPTLPPRQEGDPEIAPDRVPPPSIVAFSKGNYSILNQELEWKIGNSGVPVKIPQGFVTDGASVPKVLWPFGLTPWGLHGRTAVVHDYLYWAQVCSRTQADNLMIIAMKETGVGWFKQFILAAGVRLFGRSAWEENRRNRIAGHFRLLMLSPEFQNGPWYGQHKHPDAIYDGPRTFPGDFSWKEYDEFLLGIGAEDYLKLILGNDAREPNFPEDPPCYCSFGNTTDVPDASSCEGPG